MIKSYEKKAGVSILIGIVSFIAGMILFGMDDSGTSAELGIESALAFILLPGSFFCIGVFGTAYYAKAKGYSPWYWLLGYIGFFIILFRRDIAKDADGRDLEHENQ